MDGVFVNNISFGLPVVSGIRKICDIVFDVHLMVSRPARYIKRFAEAGADIISFHTEACESGAEISHTLELIKECKKKCALAIKPGTPARTLDPFLAQLDMVLIMSVEPGFGGQKFMDGSLEKIEYLHELKQKNNYRFDIAVDGGVNTGNAMRIKNAGANVLVAGSAIFGAEDIKSAIALLLSQS
jgi:ribulose-phosphate 3-epimerase